MNIENTIEALEKKGYDVRHFNTKHQAADYLKNSIQGKTVGFGGSQTLTELDLRHLLAENNTVFVPDFAPEGENFLTMTKKATTADYFLLSANAVSENGEIINIDGYGNRLAGALFAHQKVIYVVGANKVGGTLEEAIYRARNIAAPKNALRLHHKTPCAMSVVKRLEQEFIDSHPNTEAIDQLEWQKFIESLDEEQLGTQCYDCQSSERICGSISIHLAKPGASPAEVVLIDEPVGF